MGVQISTDIKGVAGIYHGVQTTPGTPEYERARLLMTALGADVNVAEQPGWAGISPSAFHGVLLRSGRAAFGQHRPLQTGSLSVSNGWISALPLFGGKSRKRTSPRERLATYCNRTLRSAI